MKKDVCVCLMTTPNTSEHKSCAPCYFWDFLLGCCCTSRRARLECRVWHHPVSRRRGVVRIVFVCAETAVCIIRAKSCKTSMRTTTCISSRAQKMSQDSCVLTHRASCMHVNTRSVPPRHSDVHTRVRVRATRVTMQTLRMFTHEV